MSVILELTFLCLNFFNSLHTSENRLDLHFIKFARGGASRIASYERTLTNLRSDEIFVEKNQTKWLYEGKKRVLFI